MVQRISIDIDKELWKDVGIKALLEGKKKRELVEEALRSYIKENEYAENKNR